MAQGHHWPSWVSNPTGRTVLSTHDHPEEMDRGVTDLWSENAGLTDAEMEEVDDDLTHPGPDTESTASMEDRMAQQLYQIDFLKDVVTSRDQTIRDLEGRLQAYKQHFLRVQAQSAIDEQQKMMLASLRRQVHALEIDRDKALAMSKTRLEELRAVNVYLTKADAVSEADVIRMVERLNFEIFQTACAMAEAFAEQIQPVDDKNATISGVDAADKRLCERAGSAIGPMMISLLKRMARKQNPIGLQIAFQAVITVVATRNLALWLFGHGDVETVFCKVSTEVEKGEDQALSGRWRAITSHYTQRLYPVDTDRVTSQLIRLSLDILRISGVSERALSNVKETYGPRMRRIFDLVVSVRKTIGEEITTCTFQPIVATRGLGFSPDTMIDEFSPNDYRIQRVLCPSGIGLERREKINHIVGDPTENRRTILLKSKVVTDSIVNELE
ncbi:uncharacterized protein FIBRA_06811 [Fibroporia radiculosa]|uniref:Uncharacterized protein n=1 Tax=Fibroporia radiculosa TaxID=599839 RepID=J4HZP4_9APHY|nr:uncharacterized protein FIBRA_06811 [Fibroporia radiculosa]CCM04627.1 predicted protein [Fibroporia radiculosa]